MKAKKSKWSEKAKRMAIELHSELKLNDKNWHEFKNDSEIRAAELLASAIVQLLHQGESSDIEELSKQAIRWLKREVKDPGCPR